MCVLLLLPKDNNVSKVINGIIKWQFTNLTLLCDSVMFSRFVFIIPLSTNLLKGRQQFSKVEYLTITNIVKRNKRLNWSFITVRKWLKENGGLIRKV